MGEAMRVVSSITGPLRLLMGSHPRTLIGEVAVVAPPTHVVMRVVAAALGANLSADWWWGLIGRPGARAGLLDGSQSTLSHAVWRSVTPLPFGHIIILQRLLLPQWGGQPTTLPSDREYLRPPGQLRIHRWSPAVRVPWMLLLLLPVKGV